MADKDYTPMQRVAVETEGGNLLVSASAGSGKTYVMIERVIRLILEGKTEAGRILAVTYTTAAADEMKQKLVKAIVAEINGGGNDVERLRKSLAQVPTASVSTFHSFCANLIRTYFYALPADPSFTVCDDAKSEELKNKAADELFYDLYEDKNDDFLYLVRIFRSGRSDGALKAHVKKLFDFASSEKSFAEFLENAADGVTEKAFYRAENELYEIFSSYFKELRRIFANLQTECDDLGTEKLSAHVKTITAKIDACLNAKNYREAFGAAALSVDNTPSVKSDDECVNALKEKIKNCKTRLKKVCENLIKSTPLKDEKADLDDYLATSRATAALCGLTLKFSEYYDREKEKELALDFSDLEKFAYRLLSENPDVLEEVRKKYDYVFADEYQDVNGLQEAILSLIAKDNAFMVGDVKQSIYAFRGCNPEIFAEKFDSYERGAGIPVSLDVNFRSSNAVLSAVNKTFSPVMTKDFGGADYAKNPMKGYGGYPDDYGKTVLCKVTRAERETEKRIGVYDLKKEAAEYDDDSAFSEGDAIAKIIAKELDDEIFDLKTGLKRKVTLKDIAVLTRTSSGFTTEIVTRLKRRGIPVSSASKNSVSDYPEIKLLTDLLKIIDCFTGDAPLAACLLSAIGGLKEEDLAEIRRFAPKASGATKLSFADCYLYYLERGDDAALREKLSAFDGYVAKIRLLAEFESAGEILSRVLSETGLDLEILSKPDGKTRIKRVERFIAESEAGGEKLSVRKFLSRLKNNTQDVSVGSSDGENSVTVMSMHSSKGLEFPIVILAGLNKKFNDDDLKREILADRKDGLALKLYDETDRSVKSTLVRSAFKERARLNLIKEELRVFYVAMTRAKDRLYLVSQSDVAASDDFTSVLFAGKFSDFVKTDYFDEIIEFDDETASAAKEKRPVYFSADRPSLTDKIYEYLSFSYPYESDVNLPVKRAVTRLAEESAIKSASAGYGAFADGDDARLGGIAYHAFLQYCDFSATAADNIARLKREDRLTDEQFALLENEKLEKILASPVFAALDGYKLYREQPFITSLPASEVSDAKSDGNILVQGVIDLLAIKGDEAIVVDYKTSGKSAAALKNAYAEQLAIYKKAVEKTLKLRVTRCILFNVASLETIYL